MTAPRERRPLGTGADQSSRTDGSRSNPVAAGFDLTALINAASDGRYRPMPGTAGDLLVGAHPSRDRFTAARALTVFARVALQREGLWWVMALEACDECLSDSEADYIALCWQDWCAGRNPFTGRRRHVTG